MALLPRFVQRYLDKNGVKGPWEICGKAHDHYRGVVVIPSLAEGDRLFNALRSLAANSRAGRANFLILVVVNQSELATQEEHLQNEIDLARLTDLAEASELCLAWIDASREGCALPARHAGVGLARKLGMDLALSRLNWNQDPLLVCLDADTLVEAHYLETIDRHFLQSASGAAVLPYRHQSAVDPVVQKAIDHYELFLRSYVYGLRLAGSPYAFNSIGSAMACRASAYVRCGGMNSRKAGEDFYFLQKLAKTDGVNLLSGTTVFPEPRVSERVPFGTGRSMARLLAGNKQGVLCYPVEAFRILADWLRVVEQNLASEGQELLHHASAISPVLADYLKTSKWSEVWPGIQKTHLTEAQRCQAFHAWFDGFKTLRLIHRLCEESLVRGEAEELLAEYFDWEGRSRPGSMTAMLATLREMDGVPV